MVLSSRRLETEAVTCPLKLSMILGAALFQLDIGRNNVLCHCFLHRPMIWYANQVEIGNKVDCDYI